MIQKQLLCPERLRTVPKGFGWVDHQFVRAGHVRHCQPIGLALYLVLITVSDELGLSYYSDQRLAQLLGCPMSSLLTAREQLCQSGLIAYCSPLYQVLSLPLSGYQNFSDLKSKLRS